MVLEATTEIIDSAETNDIERIGRAIDTRQRYLERLEVFKAAALTGSQKEKLNEIIILDKKAAKCVAKLFERYKNEIRNSRVKYDGMIRYYNGRYDLSSGRMFDKKR